MKISKTATLALFALSTTTMNNAALANSSSPKIAWGKMIACDYAFGDYTSFVLGDFQSEKFKSKSRIKKINQGNPFLAEYELPEPITVFGYTTNRIVFTSAGVMAVVDESDPRQTAEKLQLNVVYQAGTKIMATKTISESRPEMIGEIKVWQKTSRDLSTVDSHPGKMLIGCTYKPMMQE